MTGETANAIAEFLISASQQQRSKYINVVLFGGEPLLNIGVGFEILDKLNIYCGDNDKILTCSMVTNGSLLTDEILMRLQKYNCTMIQITIDGPPEIHNTRRVAKTGNGTFEQVINGIKLVDKYSDNIHCVIRINIDKTNILETERVLTILREAGIKKSSVDFGIVRSSTNACSSYADNCFGDNELGEVLDDLWKKSAKDNFSIYPHPVRKWIYCGVYNDNNFTIAPTGEVYKCWEMVGDEKHKIGEIASGGRFINLTSGFYDWISINPTLNDDCNDCKYLPACGGGCIMTSLNETGSHHSKGCNRIKGVVEKQVINYVETVERAKTQL